METRFGARGLISDGVFFTEDSVREATQVRRIAVEISRQNSNLAEVKSQMARQAKEAGATIIMNFRYGQRKHSWWQLLAFKWDTESWYGEGDAVRVEKAA